MEKLLEPRFLSNLTRTTKSKGLSQTEIARLLSHSTRFRSRELSVTDTEDSKTAPAQANDRKNGVPSRHGSQAISGPAMSTTSPNPRAQLQVQYDALAQASSGSTAGPDGSVKLEAQINNLIRKKLEQLHSRRVKREELEAKMSAAGGWVQPQSHRFAAIPEPPVFHQESVDTAVTPTVGTTSQDNQPGSQPQAEPGVPEWEAPPTAPPASTAHQPPQTAPVPGRPQSSTRRRHQERQKKNLGIRKSLRPFIYRTFVEAFGQGVAGAVAVFPDQRCPTFPDIPVQETTDLGPGTTDSGDNVTWCWMLKLSFAARGDTVGDVAGGRESTLARVSEALSCSSVGP